MHADNDPGGGAMRRAFLKGMALGAVGWREALAAEAPGEKARLSVSDSVTGVVVAHESLWMGAIGGRPGW